jgi:hypothetical protein
MALNRGAHRFSVATTVVIIGVVIGVIGVIIGVVITITQP